MTIPTPTNDEIRAICELYDTYVDVQTALSAVNMLVNTWPTQNEKPSVLLKVCAINQLYRTSIFDVHEVAETICANHVEFERLLAAGHAGAVDSIRKTSFKGKARDNYSFATKYCHIHQPEHFPIFDSRVERSLTALQKDTQFCDRRDIEEIRQYRVFLKILGRLRQSFSLTCSHQDLDRFLYHYGPPSR